MTNTCLSQQVYFCHDKRCVFLFIKIMFFMTEICLLRQTFCCDKHTFVVSKDVFLFYVCCDKSFVTTSILLSWRKDTCGSSCQWYKTLKAMNSHFLQLDLFGCFSLFCINTKIQMYQYVCSQHFSLLHSMQSSESIAPSGKLPSLPAYRDLTCKTVNSCVIFNQI